MSTLWLLPLAIGGVGAAVLAVAARRLDREVEALQDALQPVRTSSPTGRRGPR